MPAVSLQSSNSPSWDDLFLDWFAGLGIPMAEKALELGGLKFHYFTSEFKVADGRICRSHGKSQNRKLAALKCAAECIERQVMVEFFKQGRHGVPSSLQTSNGWAVHRTADQARTLALHETLERHLLLKSFLTLGWPGFRLIETVENQNMTLYFLTSHFSSEGCVAGLVVARSHLYPGASFGYSLGKAVDIGQASFWETAIFEAADKILLLEGRQMDLSDDPKSWIKSEIKHFLEEPFDPSILAAGVNRMVECKAVPEQIVTIDLAKKYGVDFPLFAAYAWGGDLIPLFHKPRLDSVALKYIQPILLKNGIAELPERHPII